MCSPDRVKTANNFNVVAALVWEQKFVYLTKINFIQRLIFQADACYDSKKAAIFEANSLKSYR